ncbi:MAG: aspartate 1-decarboxylase, partial [Bacteroidales bacterium]|nr:aspartate 1-decarboxylase [Bacteroidales bacterium]
AHKAGVGDLIIIASYAMMDFEEAKQHTPTVIFPQNNRLQ